jgi:hypothetical protein
MRWRTLALLLLLLNAGYWAWGEGWLLPYGFGPVPQREPQRLAQQIHPQAITILSAAEGQPPPVVVPPEPTVCLQSELMSEAQADTVRSLLLASWPPESWLFQEVATPARWIVYMGKYASQAELARRRAALDYLELRTEPLSTAALAPGLSLGAYPTQSQANAALQVLRRRGVKTAKVVQEQPAGQSFRLRLPILDSALQAQLPELRAALPNGALESCPQDAPAR